MLRQLQRQPARSLRKAAPLRNVSARAHATSMRAGVARLTLKEDEKETMSDNEQLGQVGYG